MKKRTALSIVSLIALFLGGCDNKNENDYQGVSLFITKGDYYDFVTVGLRDNQLIRGLYTDLRYTVVGSDTINLRRTRLTNDYIIDVNGDYIHDAFINFRFNDFIKWIETYNSYSLPPDTIWKYMLDKDPYIEFWRVKDNEMFLSPSGTLDTTGLNQIILDGKIEDYFNRLKLKKTKESTASYLREMKISAQKHS